MGLLLFVVQTEWAGDGTKVCAGCEKNLELHCFPAGKSFPGGRQHLCFACRAEAVYVNKG